MSTALECIDDEIAVLDEQPVAVTAVWRQVFRTVLPERVETAVLVCPTWWPSPRIERVREAAATRSTKVVVLQRADVLVDDAPGIPTVVEIAPEFVVVSRSGGVVTAEPRLGDAADVVRTVADGVGCGDHGIGGCTGRCRGCGRARLVPSPGVFVPTASR